MCSPPYKYIYIYMYIYIKEKRKKKTGLPEFPLFKHGEPDPEARGNRPCREAELAQAPAAAFGAGTEHLVAHPHHAAVDGTGDACAELAAKMSHKTAGETQLAMGKNPVFE